MTTAVVELRPVDAEADVILVGGWMQQPHVAPWWDLAGPLARTAAYLRAEPAHQDAWIASLDGEPFAFVETYRADEDPLADHVDVSPGDRGWHVLVGPPEQLGTGAARLLAGHVIDSLMAEDGAERVLCEPDVRNARMLAFCRAVGGRRIATIDLPGKRAAIFAWEGGG